MRIHIAILAASLVMVSPTAAAQQRPITTIRSLSWHVAASDSPTRGKALTVFAGTERQHRSRILWETPRGRHYILDQTIDPSAGTITDVFTDDASGWFAELTTDYRVKRPTVREFGQALHERGSSARDVYISLRTSKGPVFSSVEVDVAGDGVQPLRHFGGKLARSAAAETLRIELQSVAPELSFLAGAYSERNRLKIIGFTVLVEILGAVFTDTSTPHVVDVEEGKPTVGSSIATSEQLTFASRFRSLANPVRPLERAEPR